MRDDCVLLLVARTSDVREGAAAIAMLTILGGWIRWKGGIRADVERRELVVSLLMLMLIHQVRAGNSCGDCPDQP